MNQPDQQPPDRNELRDRLLDAALRERVGGETPPDLSEAILARASDDAAIRSLAAKETTMEIGSSHRQRRGWKGFAIAATMLVATGMVLLLLPKVQSAREAARRTTPMSNSRTAGNASLPHPDGSTPQVIDGESKAGSQQTGVPSPQHLTDDVQYFEFKMAVTPHIVIQEEEEDRLGVAQESSAEAASASAMDRHTYFSTRVPRVEPIPPSQGGTFEAPLHRHDNGAANTFMDNLSSSQQAGEAPKQKAKFLGIRSTAAEPAPTSSEMYNYSLDQPFRQGSFSSDAPQFAGGNPSQPHNYSWYSLRDGKAPRRFPEQSGGTLNESISFGWQGGSTGRANVDASGESIGLQGLINDAYGMGSERSDEDAHFVHSGEESKLQKRLKELEVETQALAASTASAITDTDKLRHHADKLQLELERRSVLTRLRVLQSKERAQTNRDQYARIHDNPFLPVSAANTDHRLSTFSIDVDTASYANVRQFLAQSGTLPPPDAVRIEELVNYFDYDYTPPTGDVPFAANVEVAGCPWAPEHRLVRVGIKGREIERTQRPLSNLVFLIDVSGSMNEPNKLPLLIQGMKQLTRELGENDRVAIVVYASSEGLALESTPGTDQSKILAALDQLRAGGSTAGGAGIQLAYQVAQKNFIKGGVNRVILCTDGDFNVGVTSPAELERMAEINAKETGVFLTVLGFGRGNLNDAMMEQVADKGNGNYHYIDTQREARKVLVEEMTGTLVAIAKDVKIQVEFNPAQVAGYRLIGYENRVLAAEDFNDDKKGAGEIGAGHTVTALYEIVPVGKPVASAAVDELKYAPGEDPLQRSGNPGEDAKAKTASEAAASDELLTLKIRYKAPDGDTSTKLEFPINDAGQTFAQSTDDFKFASAVVSFGMLLRDSQHKGNATYAAAAEVAEAASKNRDPHGYRQEFVEIVKRAQELSGE